MLFTIYELRITISSSRIVLGTLGAAKGRKYVTLKEIVNRNS